MKDFDVLDNQIFKLFQSFSKCKNVYLIHTEFDYIFWCLVIYDNTIASQTISYISSIFD